MLDELKQVRGQIVEVHFLDHCRDGNLVRATVWGRLVRVGTRSIRIHVWESRKSTGGVDKENTDFCTILTDSIQSYKQMGEVE